MKKININFFFSFLSLVVITFALSRQLFQLPPLGKLLDPFSGAVQNGDEKNLGVPRLTIDKMNLIDSVHVFFDDRKVPHIYASNAKDLYFSQGYVTACLRLWQMDFLSYVSAGRLSEILGNNYVFYDRRQRRLGLLEAARVSLKLIEKDPETITALTAYTKGVNAYIKRLTYKEMPLEYKLMGYEPEEWSNLKTVLIMEYMGNTLSGYDEDFNTSNMILALGENQFNKFFPSFAGPVSPVMNSPKPADNYLLPLIKKPDYLDYSFFSSNPIIPENSYNPKLGSNSWAVSGKKTKSGFPILCSDPHLGLSFPSVWLEMQLSMPGTNVYGVSVPGTPAIIIGFNDDIAWGITNGADDVKDWYKLKIAGDYTKYQWDGKWLDLNHRIEEIKIKDQSPLLDTIYSSIHGPIPNNKSFSSQPQLMDFALKWELLKPANDFIAFIKLSRAKNYNDYKAAIRDYSCPTQNFTFACKDNTIAIVHQGNMLIKSPGQGEFIMDGSWSSQLSTAYIPEDSLPQMYNPSCDYVLSANQHPTYPNYKYYYNGYYSENRANRIRQLLDTGNGFDIKRMEEMQLDNVSPFDNEALTVLTNAMNRFKFTQIQKGLLDALTTWKGNYDLNDENAKLFDLWWKNISDYTWDEFRQFPFYSKPPADYVLLDLIRKEPSADVFDRQNTLVKEDAGDIVYQAFVKATSDYEKLKKEGSVKWGDLNRVNIMHMANIGAFSKMNIRSAGNPETINAISSNWGPSWRMIVQLGKKPVAYGIYPGGQSGNIGGAYYDNFVNDWNKGIYYPLTFFSSQEEAITHANSTWIIK